MAITVHHLEDSRSQRVLWLLEELGIEYEVKRYPRDPDTRLGPPELRSIHPLGKSPILVDDRRVYAESGNIVEHVVEQHGGGMLKPEPGTPAADRYRFWLHYAEGSLMPLVLLRLVVGRIRSAPVPFFAKPIARMIADKTDEAFIDPQSALHLGFVESELAQEPWLCGDALTAADIQMSFPLEAAATRFDLQGYPKVREFLKRCHARPAYQRALQRGGPYAFSPLA